VRERLDVERVRLAAGLCDGLDPLHAPLSKVSGCSEGEGESERETRRTFAGSATIMWQSMNTLSTVLWTLARTGAPMVMLGTKWPSMTSARGTSRVSAGARRRERERERERTHVDPLCAAVHHALDLVAEVGKVAGEDRGRDDGAGRRGHGRSAGTKEEEGGGRRTRGFAGLTGWCREVLE